MLTIAVAVLLASIVSKEVLVPKRAALVGAAIFAVSSIAFLEHPVPVFLTTPLYFGLLWASFIFVKRASLLLLPVALLGVFAAVIGTEASRDWLVHKLKMYDRPTQARLDEFKREHPELARDAGLLD
jgi:hypothetical protein